MTEARPLEKRLWKELFALSSRIKLILTAILVVLALLITTLAAEATIQAFGNLQQQPAVVTADIRSIRPWMTILSIAQVYHVSENDLYRSLHLKGARLLRQTTLSELAARSHRSVSDLILNVQITILIYQNLHPPRGEGILSTLLTFLISWLEQYGYPVLWLIVFVASVGAPLPVGLLLLVLGAFAGLGDFNVIYLALITTSASVCGDSLGYTIGRGLGSKVLDWIERRRWYRSKSSRTIARSRAYFKRRGAWAILLSRFLFSALGGTVNLVAGADRYPYHRFLLYDGVGETLGAVIPLSLGYAFGASWEDVGDLLTTSSGCVLALLVTIFLVIRLVRIVQRVKESDSDQRHQSALQQVQSTQKTAVKVE